jgi:hypothetical protein
MTATDVALELADRAEAVVIALLGKPTGRSTRELRFGKRGSLAVRLDGAKRGQWFDHELGGGGDLLHLIARERGVATLGEAMRIAQHEFLGGASATRLISRNVPHVQYLSAVPDDSLGRTQAALQMWRETTPLGGTLGERYFVDHRRLDVRRLELAHVLRWHAQSCCVVALMTDQATNKLTGIHRTFLNSDASKRERKMLGRKGCIRLSPDDQVTLGLGLVEGVEDGLAVLLSGWAPVWAASDAGALASFPVLAGIDVLTIFADADVAGIKAAQQCAAVWAIAGKAARISPPARSRHG